MPAIKLKITTRFPHVPLYPLSADDNITELNFGRNPTPIPTISVILIDGKVIAIMDAVAAIWRSYPMGDS
ncbi:hypothetical protein TWF192_007708 [Orbilia oligospora]|uniref:Uncharacterized protein n=1 Tax=Orbilia oligospora TaxID=2813651 RepID=A0A6G1M541_ORBOL|nr:hypothetical protein TWF191_003271 [Orbilia oligospora]KAF3244416.1 hypothetical protein TWF192_007708 [Orbilia oligospora]